MFWLKLRDPYFQLLDIASPWLQMDKQVLCITWLPWLQMDKQVLCITWLPWLQMDKQVLCITWLPCMYVYVYSLDMYIQKIYNYNETNYKFDYNIQSNRYYQ